MEWPWAAQGTAGPPSRTLHHRRNQTGVCIEGGQKIRIDWGPAQRAQPTIVHGLARPPTFATDWPRAVRGQGQTQPRGRLFQQFPLGHRMVVHHIHDEPARRLHCQQSLDGGRRIIAVDLVDHPSAAVLDHSLTPQQFAKDHRPSRTIKAGQTRHRRASRECDRLRLA